MSIDIENDLITAYIRHTSLGREFTRLSDKKFKNRYLNALLRRYLDALLIRIVESRNYQVDTNITSSIIKHIYMFEIYEELDNLDMNYDDCYFILNDLLERLDKEISEDKIYNIQLEKISDLVDDLHELQCLIEHIDFEDIFHNKDSIETAIAFKEGIIERYFLVREKIYKENCKKKYKENISNKFTKRKNRENEYLQLLNSYDYRTKRMSKREIATALGVKPSAVTQFCKRHNIR